MDDITELLARAMGHARGCGYEPRGFGPKSDAYCVCDTMSRVRAQLAALDAAGYRIVPKVCSGIVAVPQGSPILTPPPAEDRNASSSKQPGS